MFVYDLAKVVFRGLIIRIAFGRIANVCRASQSIWNVLGLIAGSIERQIDIAGAETTGSRDLTGVCLVEDVEKARAELKLLGLAEVKILEEGDVKVAPAGSSQVEGWLCRTSVRELGNRNGVQVEILITNLATTGRWIV